MATIANGMRLLVWGKITAEDSLGLVLLLCGSFFDDRLSINRSASSKPVFYAKIYVDYTIKYQSDMIKSRPRMRAALALVAMPSKAEINSCRGYYSNKYGSPPQSKTKYSAFSKTWWWWIVRRRKLQYLPAQTHTNSGMLAFCFCGPLGRRQESYFNTTA